MKSYYQDKWVTIYHGDCREILPLIPDKSIEMCITSPPFNLGDKHHTGSYYINPYEDDMPELDYQEWQSNILDSLFEKVIEGGSLWYQHKNRIKDGQLITPYSWLLYTKWTIKQEIVWFNGSQNFDKRRFYPMTERLYWLATSPEVKLENVLGLHDDWHIEPVGVNKTFPRAYPEMLVERILASFPDIEEIIDPFLGSGTTAYCAKKLNRKCIGIEIEEKYCEIAAKRCLQEVMELGI